ncbi:MAG: bifunctional DNA-formamidopyrimidine glycosylase/DNA-(apurinic or apyrimidinic site) lyase [Cyanobacteria bacterium SZAS LIN-3]|nr:bifunctional DNA-formamidopyrimidine glycosylase/DNA-(apurinic or apyrimidinic site) lyase [Cyanobacteria bacterium SZAS LIN-3]
MPELPEVETVRRGLEVSLKGDTITSVEVLREASVQYPDVETFASKLVGHKFGPVLRRGKYLLLELDRGAGLACHLRMSGRLIVRDERKPAKKKAGSARQPQFLRVIIFLESGRELHFEDMRVFGRLWYKPKGASFEKVIPTLAELGVEPLENLSAAYLKSAFSKKIQAVKTALLDQRIIAGVGNIYADESLFLSRIHPATPARDIKLAQLEVLVDNVKKVLERAIESGGSTLRDYSDSNGVNGNYQHEAFVYGREDKPCRECGALIERTKLGGRSSHYCPFCQPKPRKAKSRVRASK